MKIKFGSLIVAGSGKIGGHVASKNRGGAYLRTKVTPINPSTSYQVNVRARLATLAQGWKALTAAQRAAFNNAVSAFKRTNVFGDIINPSGINLYTRLNMNLLNLGESAITLPPAPAGVSVFDSLTVAAAAGTPALTATVSPATLPSGEQIIVRATPAVSPGRSFVKSDFRQIAVIDTVAGGSINLLSAYAAKFGNPAPAGNRIFVEIVHVNEVTGEVSQAQQAIAVVAA